MTPPDIEALQNQLDVAERDAQALVSGLDEKFGTWRASQDSWSVAQCLDHLATGNRIYLTAMQEAAARAREQGRRRCGPATPGLIGRWFVKYMEPPVKRLFKTRAPRKIRPRSSPTLRDAFGKFIESHHELGVFLQQNADLDLAHIRFVNPFIYVIRFSLATGLHVLPAHERRHLWQAWRVRASAEKNAIESGGAA